MGNKSELTSYSCSPTQPKPPSTMSTQTPTTSTKTPSKDAEPTDAVAPPKPPMPKPPEAPNTLKTPRALENSKREGMPQTLPQPSPSQNPSGSRDDLRPSSLCPSSPSFQSERSPRPRRRARGGKRATGPPRRSACVEGCVEGYPDASPALEPADGADERHSGACCRADATSVTTPLTHVATR